MGIRHNLRGDRLIMMRIPVLLSLLLGGICQLEATQPCTTIHGRARFYSGDGQLRIWQIGTHHEFEPDQSTWDSVMGWLEAGVKQPDRVKYASPAQAVDLFADFLICPTEPLKQGAVQHAKVKSASHRHYVIRE